jgi:capsular polysaccharide biosynthesis protein
MKANPVTTYADEIDLREIALILWKGRWLIIVLTLVAALVAFAVSAWLLPKQYQAVAYVTVSSPLLRYQTGDEGGLAAIPAIPDIKALPELVQAKVILEEAASDARITSLLESDGKRLDNKTQVSAVGVSQLRFQVTDTDPQRTAAFATVWAEKAADWIEINYGVGAFVANIEAQIAQTQQAYIQAQSTLETFLAQDQTPILQSRFEAQKNALSCLETRVSAAESLLLRLGEFETRLAQSDAGLLSLSDAVLLASIQQDIDSLETCDRPGAILQSSSPLLFTGLSLSQGMEVIASMRDILQQRIADSQNGQESAQNEALKLQVEIERLNYQRTEYIRQRDQAKTFYEQLVFQRAVRDDVLQQSGRVANVSAEAVAPKAASSPQLAVNTGAAGLLGLMLGIGWVVAVDRWKKR